MGGIGVLWLPPNDWTRHGIIPQPARLRRVAARQKTTTHSALDREWWFFAWLLPAAKNG
ncbi:hypothetical protein Poly30_02560 [Planctomycetes bacterium Poly30]|uniref:Uncharacterized protein n=1 Tax=Saltatorellus ferox TaxID=2528018 RepID=A0A518EKZ1_9BACT|nr:hypothetical protein Poly30_02560 [Planctomycetes bacterium Poly30]